MANNRWLGFVIVFCLFGFPLAQAKEKSANLSDEQLRAVQDVTDYFNSFQTLRGNFTQLGASGSVSTGAVLIAKPGKMRFEYSAPNPFVVVSDGRWVAVVNRSKKVADQYPLITTPLRLLLAEKMDLLRSAIIKAADTQDGLITLRLEDRDQMVSGELVVIFDSKENTLKQWVVVDGEGRRTTITLDNLQMDVPADPKLFLVEIDRKTGKPSSN